MAFIDPPAHDSTTREHERHAALLARLAEEAALRAAKAAAEKARLAIQQANMDEMKFSRIATMKT